MSGFPDISRHLARDQEIIHKSLARACGLLPERVFAEYSASARKMVDQPELLNSSIRWFLYHYFLFSGFIQGIVAYDDQPVFTFGAQLLPWDINQDREFPPDFFQAPAHGIPAASALTRIFRTEQRGHRRLSVEGVAPNDIEPIVSSMLDLEMMPIARNYYFNDPGIQDHRVVDYLSQVEEQCDVLCARTVETANVFSVSHFRFQDMSIYFEMSGEKGGGELMQAIHQVIRQNLKRSDVLFQLSPFSFLALSPGADRSQIFERLQNVYFGYKSLYMDYQLRVVTLNEHPDDWSEIWSDLKV